LKQPLTIKLLHKEFDQGNHPEFSPHALEYLEEIPDDHCFICTNKLKDHYFPVLVVKLGKKNTAWASLNSYEPVEPNIKFNFFENPEGDACAEVELLFPGNRHLHLMLDPAHPHVQRFLMLMTKSRVFGLTFRHTATHLINSGYNDIDPDQQEWFVRNLPKARAVRKPNNVRQITRDRKRMFPFDRSHRFLTFAQSTAPALLAEDMASIALQSDTLTPLEEINTPEFNFDWLATAHGLTVTRADYLPEHPKFLEDIIGVTNAPAPSLRGTIRDFERLLAKYPEQPLLLKQLHEFYLANEDFPKAAKIEAKLYGIRHQTIKTSIAHLQVQNDPVDLFAALDRFPQPVSISHLPPGPQGQYTITDFIDFEAVAIRYDCLQGRFTAALERLDRLIKTGVPKHLLAEHLSSLAMTRIDELSQRKRPGNPLSFTDIHKNGTQNYHQNTLLWLRHEISDLILEITGDAPIAPVKRATPKVGRNAPCPCGSGKKYKRCCGRG
jgi:hypothetical protein